MDAVGMEKENQTMWEVAIGYHNNQTTTMRVENEDDAMSIYQSVLRASPGMVDIRMPKSSIVQTVNTHWIVWMQVREIPFKSKVKLPRP